MHRSSHIFSLSAVLGLLITIAGCQSVASVNNTPPPAPELVASADTVVIATQTDTLFKPYTSLEYSKVELLQAAPGTKSVLFNTNGSKLYAMNLEGMSVYEFDQASRKIIRE